MPRGLAGNESGSEIEDPDPAGQVRFAEAESLGDLDAELFYEAAGSYHSGTARPAVTHREGVRCPGLCKLYADHPPFGIEEQHHEPGPPELFPRGRVYRNVA